MKGAISAPISSKNSLKKIVRIQTLGKKNPNTEQKKNSVLPPNRYKMVCTIKSRRSDYPMI